MSMDLRMREGRTLAEKLTDELEAWSERTGRAVEIWALPGDDVPRRVTEAVLVTVRAALSAAEANHATTVSVAVTSGRRGLRLTVSDDGQGLPRVSAETRVRAAFAEVGGAATVNWVPRGGTTVSGTVPRRRGLFG